MLLVTQSVSLFGDDKDSVRQYITERNASILIGAGFPTSTGSVSVKELIGDPNLTFSEDIAALLAEHEILYREPCLDEKGKHSFIVENSKKSYLWNYHWHVEDFIVLDEPTLYKVAWDLRHCPGFFNVVVINPEESTSEPVDNLNEDDNMESDTDNNDDDLDLL